MVLKVLSRRIAHKSDVGGVRVGVPAADPRRLRAMLEQPAARRRTEPEGFLVQELVGAAPR